MNHLLTVTRCITAATVGCLWTAVAQTATNSPAEKMQACFQCQGAGTTKCTTAGCLNGQMDCPASCIKLRKGKWEKRPNRPDPNETMQSITVAGKGFWVSSHHEGVYYVLDANRQLVMQECPSCHGATRVQCKICTGTGIIKCPICDGKKQVPASWSAFDNPKMKDRPSRFKLKGERELVGRKVAVMGSRTRIRTETGDTEVDTADIISEERQSSKR